MVFAVVQTDLPSRICSELADVTFSFDTESSITNGKKEIKANKTILALASEVFKTQFFGSIPAEAVVPVKDSNAEAFSIFLEILYNEKIQLKDMNPMLLGDLFYLAEKYQVDAIKCAIVEDINLRQIEIEDVIGVLTVVESKSQLVQFAESMYKLCLKVVLKSSDNICKLFSMSDPDDESTSRMLHRFMSKAHTLKDEENAHTLKDEENDKVCNNCQQFPCLDGSRVDLNNFVENAVTRHDDSGSRLVGEVLTLIRAEEDMVKVLDLEKEEFDWYYPGDLVYKCVSKKN